MHIFEVAIRELVSSFPVLVLLIIDSQVPLAILIEAICTDEFVLFLRGRLMFTPLTSCVVDELT